MKKLFPLFVLATFVFMANTAFATTQACGIISGGSSGGETVSSTYAANLLGQANEGCNVLITFNADGSIVTTHPNSASSYDSGADDNEVGIINNSGTAITQLHLTSASDIFGFDGDGICGGYTFSALGPNCTGGSGYLPAGVTDTIITVLNGYINFSTPVAGDGGTGWFSLEEPVALDLEVSAVPEPSSLLLLGTGVLGLVGFARRRLKS